MQTRWRQWRSQKIFFWSVGGHMCPCDSCFVCQTAMAASSGHNEMALNAISQEFLGPSVNVGDEVAFSNHVFVETCLVVVSLLVFSVGRIFDSTRRFITGKQGRVEGCCPRWSFVTRPICAQCVLYVLSLSIKVESSFTQSVVHQFCLPWTTEFMQHTISKTVVKSVLFSKKSYLVSKFEQEQYRNKPKLYSNVRSPGNKILMTKQKKVHEITWKNKFSAITCIVKPSCVRSN